MRFATIATPAGPRAALFDGGSYIDLHATESELPTSVRALSRSPRSRTPCGNGASEDRPPSWEEPFALTATQ